MRSKTIILCVAVLTVLLMASFSFAENVPPPKLECQENFKAMDTNNDNTLSKQEFMAAPHGHMKSPEQMFTSWDTNGDKSLDLEEFCAHAGKGMGRGKGMTGKKGMKKGQPY
jgi:opacity protein-like surface antigen